MYLASQELPFISFEQMRAEESDDRGVVEEDADDIGANKSRLMLYDDEKARPAFPDARSYSETRERVHTPRKVNRGKYEGDVELTLRKRDASSETAGQSGEQQPEMRHEAPPVARGEFIAKIGVVIGGLGLILNGFEFELQRQQRPAPNEFLDVTSRFANKMARYNYNDPIFETRSAEPIREGELALFNSLHFHRTGRLDNLTANLERLREAADVSVDPDARAFIHARRMIDANALSRGDIALDSLSKINFDELFSGDESSVYARVVDYAATVTLNTLQTEQFLRFEDDKLQNVIGRWKPAVNKASGLTRDEMNSYIREVGLGIFTIVQAQCIALMPSAEGTGALSSLREKWVSTMMRAATTNASDLSEKMNQHERDRFCLQYAEDFLHSLCRPAFHAFHSGDFEHYRHISALYFGTAKESQSYPYLKAASRVIADRMPTGAQWMSLLDVAYSMRFVDPDAAISKFRKLQWLCKPKNTVVAQTAVALLNSDVFTSVRSELPAPTVWHKGIGVSMHRPYYDIILGG